MIYFFTDFGWQGPYVGQMKAAVAAVAPQVPVVDLMHDAPAFRPDLAGHLLAALAARLPAGALVVAVVDPGVGTDRAPVLVDAGGLRLVGPDNGLFAALLSASGRATVQRIAWRPDRLSASFHGRDLFAPAAARLAAGLPLALAPAVPAVSDPGPQARIIYIDGFGNAMTGLPADTVPPEAEILAGDHRLRAARTFGAVPPGQAFWYRNSLDLVELAVNQESAAQELGLTLNSRIRIA